ncbi:sortase [Altererythrobacter xixiisoli]|uniref:Sortase n=1 Tax=Croceibacterium xixiisoli TaxID=1476466 RepID=A0A6I4TVY7_9SPHN|nr:class D sortase [Croceibacterium xixiisoli]MXO98758.1 sortase [Croceibacterium xixiisoli]
MIRIAGYFGGGRAIGRGLFLLACLGGCAAGLGMIAQGAAVPVTAHVAQQGLEQQFEQQRAVFNRAAKPVLSAPAGTSNRAAAVSAPALNVRQTSVPVTLPAQGPIARLTVERLGISEIILGAAADMEGQLRRAPVLISRSSGTQPVSVMAAHRDTHFLFIRDLQPDDVVRIEWVTGQEEQYRITGFATLRWDEFAYPLDPDRPLLALSTCYPFGGTEYGGPWRRVAWAEKISQPILS